MSTFEAGDSCSGMTASPSNSHTEHERWWEFMSVNNSLHLSLFILSFILFLLIDMFATANELQIITHSSVKPHLSYFLFHTQDTCQCAWAFPTQMHLILHEVCGDVSIILKQENQKLPKELLGFLSVQRTWLLLTHIAKLTTFSFCTLCCSGLYVLCCNNYYWLTCRLLNVY